MSKLVKILITVALMALMVVAAGCGGDKKDEKKMRQAMLTTKPKNSTTRPLPEYSKLV